MELGQKFPMAGEYLLHIYLIQRDYNEVSNSRLAARMNVSRPAVSQAIKRLQNLELVKNKENGAFTLTEKGRGFAASVLRRHYLLEQLLVNHLGYPWEKADIEASLLQDRLSGEFTAFLYEKLGRPKTCPHGNPFPETPDEGHLLGASPLSRVRSGHAVQILRITEEGEEVEDLLPFCHREGLLPGTSLSVISSGENSIQVSFPDRKQTLTIPFKFSDYIRVDYV